MPAQNKDKDKRRARDRRRAVRRRYIVAQLRLQSDVLCESHTKNKAKDRAIIARMLRNVLILMGDSTLNQAKREAFRDHLSDCAYTIEPFVELGEEFERDLVHISGVFNMRELSKRMIWDMEV